MSVRIPLTAQQQWLWNLLQQHPDWPSVAAYAFRVRGPLDVKLLQRCLDEVVRRHGALRTRCVTVDGVPFQEIEAEKPYPLRVVQVDESEASQRVEQIYDEGLDVAAGPLFVVRLLRLTATEHWLIAGAHRLIGDCHSIDQIVEELWALYGQLADVGSVPSLASPAQYDDYARRQLANQSDWLRRHERYWVGRLEGGRPLQWPDEDGDRALADGALSSMSCDLGAELSASVHAFARRERALSASVMFAIYIAVLWRACGQRDFIMPFMIAGRQSEHAAVIGYFSHIMYLRLRLTGRETLRQLVSAVSTEFYRTLSHQDFGRMAVRYPDLLGGAFFQWLSWHQQERLGPAVPGADDPRAIDVQRLPIREFAAGLTAIPPGKVDIEVTFFDTADGIRASGVYRANRFSARRMERFMKDLRLMTQEMVHDADAALSQAEAAT